MNRVSEKRRSDGGDALDALAEITAVRALIAAARTGVWKSLLESEYTIDDLVRRHALAPSALRRVLDLMEARDWVRVQDDRWSVCPEFAQTCEALPEPLYSYLERLTDLESFLADGRPTRPFGVGDDYAEVVADLGSLFGPTARELAEKLPFRASSVLDLGTGAGVFGIAVARHHRASKLVGLDRPEVVPAFEQSVGAAGLGDIAEGCGGDFLTSQLPGGIDTVLICNVLRILSAEDAKTLLQRVSDTYDGKDTHVVVLDVIGEDAPEFRLRRSMYRLELALRNATGSPPPEDQLFEWYSEAGLTFDSEIALETAPLGEVAHVLFV